MSIPKKQTITRHKQANTKIGSLQPAISSTSGGGQSFDIIPRSKFQPSVTARPVLTPTSPEQADNTLQTSSQAASSKLTHSTLKFGTTDGPETPATAPEIPSSSSLLDQVASLAALAAKPRTIEPELAADAPIDTDIEVAPDEPTTAEKTMDKTAETIEPQAAQQNDTDLNAVAEASAALDAQHPKLDPVPITSPASPVANPESSATTDIIAPKPTPAPAGDVNTDSNDSLSQALKEDEDKPIEHSQALKDELKGMTSETDSDEPIHHDLYGGKPVIVVHKAHGSISTTGWVLWFIACLLVALLTVDVLLDSGVITIDYNVPHTHFLQ